MAGPSFRQRRLKPCHQWSHVGDNGKGQLTKNGGVGSEDAHRIGRVSFLLGAYQPVGVFKQRRVERGEKEGKNSGGGSRTDSPRRWSLVSRPTNQFGRQRPQSWVEGKGREECTPQGHTVYSSEPHRDYGRGESGELWGGGKSKWGMSFWDQGSFSRSA